MRAGIDLSAETLIALRHAGQGTATASRSSSRTGTLPGRKRGLGLDIHDLRHFVEGDDPRHLDAAATARSGQPHVRTFLEEEDRTTLLVADFRGPMLWGSRGRLRSVAAAEALALAGWGVIEAGGKVGALVLSDQGPTYIAPRPRAAAMLQIAAALASAHALALEAPRPEAPVMLDTALERVGRLLRPGATLLLASGLDDPGDDLENVLGSLRRGVRLVLYAVRDALETAPPARHLPVADGAGLVRWAQFSSSAPEARALFARAGAEIVDIAAADPDSSDQARPA